MIRKAASLECDQFTVYSYILLNYEHEKTSFKIEINDECHHHKTQPLEYFDNQRLQKAIMILIYVILSAILICKRQNKSI